MPLSGQDWTRIQRLKKSVQYGRTIDLINNTDLDNHLTPPRSNPFNPETRISRVVGSGLTRREASKWVDYKAAVVQDWVTRTEGTTCTTLGSGSSATLNTLCIAKCATPFNAKVINQTSRKHLRMM